MGRGRASIGRGVSLTPPDGERGEEEKQRHRDGVEQTVPADSRCPLSPNPPPLSGPARRATIPAARTGGDDRPRPFPRPRAGQLVRAEDHRKHEPQEQPVKEGIVERSRGDPSNGEPEESGGQADRHVPGQTFLPNGPPGDVVSNEPDRQGHPPETRQAIPPLRARRRKGPLYGHLPGGPHPPDHRGVPADGPPGFEAAGIVCRLSRPEPPPAGRGGPPARRILGGAGPCGFPPPTKTFEGRLQQESRAFEGSCEVFG